CPHNLYSRRKHIQHDLGKPCDPAFDGPAADTDLKERQAPVGGVPAGELVSDVAVAEPLISLGEDGMIRRPLDEAGLEVRESHCAGNHHVHSRPTFMPTVAAAWARSARSIT